MKDFIWSPVKFSLFGALPLGFWFFATGVAVWPSGSGSVTTREKRGDFDSVEVGGVPAPLAGNPRGMSEGSVCAGVPVCTVSSV